MTDFGFRTPLMVELIDDLANDGRGQWRLLEPLVFISENVGMVAVNKGFVTDFASVPRAPLAFWIAGDRAHRAAVVHDYLIRLHLVDRRIADDVFLEAMLSVGMSPTIANAMHLAVRSQTESMKPPGQEGKGHEFI